MGKVVLITGASSGIGEVTARYLSEKGNHLVLVARNKDKLEQLTTELPEKSYIFTYDLCDLENIEDIFTFCKEQGLTLDGLVHCAGMNRDIPIRLNDIQDMIDVTSVNYFSFVELGKYFSKKKYSNDNSSIVAISSMAVKTCNQGMCTYAASKAALNSTIKVMAKEFAKRKIRVNAILPSFVNTDMITKAKEYSVSMEDRIMQQPLGIIEPIYVSYFIDFLLSEQAKYISGSLIPMTAAMG